MTAAPKRAPSDPKQGPTAEPRELGTWGAWHSEETPLRVGVSTCLLGEPVRFDGGHARSRFVTDQLGAWLEWEPVCPELEAGMGVPRPTVRLIDEQDGGELRLVAPKTEQDFTDAMRSFSKRRVGELAKLELDGYVLKKDSPSCGMERIRIYFANGHLARKTGRGLFAEELMARDPALPVEEEGRLNDPRLRENFIERIFCRNRWRVLCTGRKTRAQLVAFHTAHKLLLRAHNLEGYRELGRIVAAAGKPPEAELYRNYEEVFQRTLRHLGTPRKHADVLQHAMGYLKKVIASPEKRVLLAAIDDFRRGMLPLVVPLSLLRFNIVQHEVDYLSGQLYFDPHPKELMLRNHC